MGFQLIGRFIYYVHITHIVKLLIVKLQLDRGSLALGGPQYGDRYCTIWCVYFVFVDDIGSVSRA